MKTALMILMFSVAWAACTGFVVWILDNPLWLFTAINNAVVAFFAVSTWELCGRVNP
jgi:hypothetical protein